MNPSSSYEIFLAYRAVILRAIGRAWSDHDFKKQLIAHPKTALKNAFGYDFPYDMEVSVIKNSATWSPQGSDGWTNLSQNDVRLVLPPKPESGQEAAALAEYNFNNLTFLSPLPKEHQR